MKETTKQIRHCPKCNREYVASPAISRRDNKTEICPNCGLLESLDAFSEHLEKEKQNAQNIIAKSYRRKTIFAVISLFIITILSISAGLCVKQGDWPLVFLNCSLIVVNLILFSKLIDN